MKIKYTGTPGEDHQSVKMYGTDFPKGKWVEVNNSFAKSKLKNHPHFEAQAEDKAEDIEVKSVGQMEAEQAKVNAQADKFADTLKADDKIDSAADYQRFEEQADAPNGVAPDHTPESEEEYQRLEEKNQVPNPVRRGPGRPGKAK